MKKCTICGETKPLAAFSRDSSHRDGLQSRCKACERARSRAYYEANPEAEQARARAYREANPEAAQARNRAYYEANREAEQARSRAWYAANPEACQAGSRAWREANREAQRDYDRTYREANLEAVQARNRTYMADHPESAWASDYRRRAKQAGYAPIVQNFTRADVIARYGNACAYCGGPFGQLDHAVPVSRGGPHTLENVRPSCQPCNRSKGSKTPDELSTILTTN